MLITSTRRIELRSGKDIIVIESSDKPKEYSDDLKTIPYFQDCLKDKIIKYVAPQKTTPIVKKEIKKEEVKPDDKSDE